MAMQNLSQCSISFLNLSLIAFIEIEKGNRHYQLFRKIICKSPDASHVILGAPQYKTEVNPGHWTEKVPTGDSLVHLCDIREIFLYQPYFRLAHGAKCTTKLTWKLEGLFWFFDFLGEIRNNPQSYIIACKQQHSSNRRSNTISVQSALFWCCGGKYELQFILIFLQTHVEMT